MMLRDHPVGGQTFVRGNFVNAPVDIAPTVNTLPRSLSETETVAIKFKRKKQYKKCEYKETVRPLAVWKALNYLLRESPLYKEANIKVDTSWLDSMNSLQDNDRELISEKTKSDNGPSVDRSDEYVNQISDTEREFGEKLCEDDSIEESDVESETFTKDNGDNLETCAADMDTILDD